MSRRSIFVGLLFALSCSTITSGALAQTKSLSDVEKRAANELSGELLECSIYLKTSAMCMEGNPDPRIPQLSKTLEENATKLGDLAMSTGAAVGRHT